ncbi:hypothetical protein HYFRA_00012093 [Hymenoscyphus fraxineus]|uniref:Uncharacterized protein n=1 Tax=Hymenoscyphus fraxineus TaxID=746836 RepID=A0A9N9L033_9HELO|nr:hypothetical protein HYFRA_00012093 [Hymenoscyphus fraxineus]
MSPALFDCPKKAFLSLVGCGHSSKGINKANDITKSLYLAQEPVPGLYSIDQEKRRYLVALKTNGDEDTERLFKKNGNGDLPSDPDFINKNLNNIMRNTLDYRVNHSYAVFVYNDNNKNNNTTTTTTNKEVADWQTNININEPLPPPSVDFGQERYSSLASSSFMPSTSSQQNNRGDNYSFCSSKIDECPPMKYTRRDDSDSEDGSDTESISGFSFQLGEDRLTLDSKWHHDRVPLSQLQQTAQQENDSASIISMDEDFFRPNTSAPSSYAHNLLAPKKRHRFGLSLHQPKKSLTSIFKRTHQNTTNNNNGSSYYPSVKLPHYSFLEKPFEITPSAIHNRWFIKAELDQRTLYRNTCATYNCTCEDYCQGMVLRRWKLLDDGYSWVPKDEQVLLVDTPPSPPRAAKEEQLSGFWSFLRKSSNKPPQATTQATYRTQLEDPSDDEDDYENTPNEPLSINHPQQYLVGQPRGDKVGTEGEVLFFLEKMGNGDVQMRAMSEAEMDEARHLQRERKGMFLVFEGNEGANDRVLRLGRVLERGGEMWTFMSR